MLQDRSAVESISDREVRIRGVARGFVDGHDGMNPVPHLALDGPEKVFDALRLPLGDQLDTAVGLVPHEPVDGEPAGESLGGEPEPDPLDPARVKQAATYRRHWEQTRSRPS